MSEIQLTTGSDARPAEAPPPGMSLRRLLTITAITPGQAALLARDIAEEVNRRDADGLPRAIVDKDTAWICPDGRLRLFDQPSPQEPAPADDAAAALRMVRLLGREAGAGRSRSHDDSARPLIDLDAAPDDLADALARVHAAASEVLVDDHQAELVRRELAALTHAVQGHLNGDDGPTRRVAVEHPEPRPHSPPPVTHPDWGSARRKAWHRSRPRVRWKVLAGVIVIIAAIVAGWVGLPRAWSELESGWNSLFGTEVPPQTLIPVPPVPDQGEAVDAEDANPEAAAAEPDSLEPPAPQSAGPITGIGLTTEGVDCAAGERCLVRTEVGLEPAGTTRSISWTLEIVDRCSGDTTTAPGVTVAAQAGWTQVWGNSELQLPEGTALAIYAVTDSPADAASPALLVPADGSC